MRDHESQRQETSSPSETSQPAVPGRGTEAADWTEAVPGRSADLLDRLFADHRVRREAPADLAPAPGPTRTSAPGGSAVGPVHDDPGLEHEAEELGARAARGESAPVAARAPAAAQPARSGGPPRSGSAPSPIASGGAAIDPAVRTPYERAFSADLGHVRVHSDQAAAQLCERHYARALAQGSAVYFAAGQYDPHSEAGRQLLGHELVHVMQQRGGPGGAIQPARDGKYLPRGGHAYGGPTYPQGGRGYNDHRYGEVLIRSGVDDGGTNRAVSYHISVPFSDHRERFESIHVTFQFADGDGRQTKLFQFDFNADFEYRRRANTTAWGELVAEVDCEAMRERAEQAIRRFAAAYRARRDEVEESERQEEARNKADTPQKRKKDKKTYLKASKTRSRKQEKKDKTLKKLIAEEQKKLGRPLNIEEIGNLCERLQGT